METPRRNADSPDRASGARTLFEDELAANPVDQFSSWFAQAVDAGLPEPNAMVLATTSAEGHTRCRTVLLKAHDDAGFVFYSNRTSRKGTDLAGNSWACVLFPWYGLGRQVTIEGPVSPLSTEQSEPYFRSRARGSQIGAWAQPAVPGDRFPRGPRRAGGRARTPVAGGHGGADARFLGRLPARTANNRILAVAGKPAPRPASVSQSCRWVGH